MPPKGDVPVPASKVAGFIAYLLPVVFAAGSTVAGYKYLASEQERLSARVEQAHATSIERERRIQTLESVVRDQNRRIEDSERSHRELESRAAKLERNQAVICTTRGLTCER